MSWAMVRVTDEELGCLRALALAEGLSVSDWVRQAVRASWEETLASMPQVRETTKMTPLWTPLERGADRHGAGAFHSGSAQKPSKRRALAGRKGPQKP